MTGPRPIPTPSIVPIARPGGGFAAMPRSVALGRMATILRWKTTETSRNLSISSMTIPPNGAVIVRRSAMWLENKKLGRVTWGLWSEAKDDITKDNAAFFRIEVNNHHESRATLLRQRTNKGLQGLHAAG